MQKLSQPAMTSAAEMSAIVRLSIGLMMVLSSSLAMAMKVWLINFLVVSPQLTGQAEINN